MSRGAQLAIALLIALVIAGGGWYLAVNPMKQTNDQNEQLLKQKVAQNENLRQYERDLPGLEREIAALEQQLTIQRTIVPDEKEAPAFMHMMQDTAASAGVQIRRYTSEPVATRPYYTEAPYQMDIDGSYYSVVDFFEKVAKLQRIINVSGLQVASVKKPSDAKVKGTYDYAPGETVVASCVTTTFFSHDNAQATAPAATPGRK